MRPHRADPAQSVPAGSAFLQLIIRSATGSASTWIKPVDDFPRGAGLLKGDRLPVAQVEAKLAAGTAQRDDPVGVSRQPIADKRFIGADSHAGIAGNAKRGIDDRAVVGEFLRRVRFPFELQGCQRGEQSAPPPIDFIGIGARLRQSVAVGFALTIKDQPHDGSAPAFSYRDVKRMRVLKLLPARVARATRAVTGEDVKFAHTFLGERIEIAMAERVPAGERAVVRAGRFAAGSPCRTAPPPREEDRQRALKRNRIARARWHTEPATIAGGGIERKFVVVEKECLSRADGDAGFAARERGQRMHAHACVDARKGTRTVHRHQLGAAPGRKREASSCALARRRCFSSSIGSRSISGMPASDTSSLRRRRSTLTVTSASPA